MRRTVTLLSSALFVLAAVMAHPGSAQSLLKDLIPGAHPASLSPEQYTDVNGTMFFLARTGNPANHQIWKSDGTAEGTVKVKDSIAITNLGGVVTFQTHMNGFLYYTVSTNPAVSSQLWKTDGFVTAQVENFTYQNGKGISPKNFIATGNKLFFQMAINNGLELWVTDGTEAGSREVINLDPGTSNGVQYNGTQEATMIAYKDRVYFAGETSLSNYELFASDGTAAGTLLVKELAAGTFKQGAPGNWKIYNNELYFTGSDGTRSSLWKTDGTTTTQLTTTVSAGSMVIFKKALYFIAGIDLWKTDGTIPGTVFVYDSAIVSGFSGATEDYLYTSFARFKPVAPYYDYFYYKTDGTTAGTHPVSYEEFNRSSFLLLGNKMYKALVENATNYTSTLWASEGSSVGAKIVTGYVGYPFIFKDKVYFSNHETATGYELWVYDPSAPVTGSEEIKLSKGLDIYPNPSSGLFTIRDTDNRQIEYAVYTLRGEKVQEISETTSIDLTNEPKGFYFVNIKTGSGNYTKKILVH